MTKKIVVYAIPYLIVIALLVLAELALRWSMPSLEIPIVMEKNYDNIEWYQINRGYLKKYFPTDTPLIPEFKESLFRKEKVKNVFRVFCLGESSMFGTPYQMTANIPGILRKQLRNAYPEKEIEVINWGAAAINSNAILDLSKSIAQFKPDLICVYMGHNEFYGPEGIGASFLERHFPSLIPLKYKVRDLRIVSILSSVVWGRKDQPTAERNLMKQVSQGAHVQLGSADAQWVFNHFEANFKSLIDLWKDEHVPLIVSDVSSNLMFPPFIHDALPPQTVNVALADFQAGKFDTVLGLLEPFHLLDSTNAFVEYWIGRSLLSKRWGGAKQHLVRARDNDLLKFRAPSRIDMIIRRACEEKQVPFISADSLFSSLSNYDIPGDDLFWEHLHPQVNGYYAIARLFLQEILRQRLVPNVVQSPARAILPFNMDSLSICWLDQAYADLSIQHLTGRWPFENYSRKAAVIDSATGPLREIAVATYQQKLVWDEACYKTAEYFWRMSRTTEAQTTYEAIIAEYPYNFYAHYMLGNLLAKMGDTQGALRHFDISAHANDAYPNSRLDAGLLLINEGKFDAAIETLRKALPLTNEREKKEMRANVLYGLAAAHANRGDYDEALRTLDEALKLIPSYADAVKLKAGILQHLKK